MLAFSLLLTSCSNGSTGGGGNNGGNNGGSTTNTTYTSSTSLGGSAEITGGNGSWSITAPVKYDTKYTTDITDAKSRDDFSYTFRFIDNSRALEVKPITSVIPGASVTVSNENVTINLGVPKSEYLDTFDLNATEEYQGSITVSPADAKLFSLGSFSTSDLDADSLGYETDTGYILACANLKGSSAALCYVDKDVTITGIVTFTDTWTDAGTTYKDTYTYKFNVSMKAGWNYFITTRGTTTPSGHSWYIVSPYAYWRAQW